MKVKKSKERFTYTVSYGIRALFYVFCFAALKAEWLTLAQLAWFTIIPFILLFSQKIYNVQDKVIKALEFIFMWATICLLANFSDNELIVVVTLLGMMLYNIMFFFAGLSREDLDKVPEKGKS